MSQTKCYLCFLSSASAKESEKVNQKDKVNNANSAFILINLQISRGCPSGSIGQGGPAGQGGPGGPGFSGGQGGQDGQGGQGGKYDICIGPSDWPSPHR